MAINLEDEQAFIAQALPTPNDTPYRTPTSARSLSWQSRRHESPSPGPSSSPPPLPPKAGNSRDSIDYANDDSISPLDPRRFTPTLHANLVSEILSLRRDLESKSKAIDVLEGSLHNARSDHEVLTEKLAATSKERRSLNRQMQLLEGGTLSALSELAKERDDAVGSLSDMRKRLEQSQKKARSHEEATERTQLLWDREKDAWDSERRNMERKMHVVEGRLKTVLAEVATAQNVSTEPHAYPNNDFEERARSSTPARGSDTTSIRTSSALDRRSLDHRRRTSTNSVSTRDDEVHAYRFSALGLSNGLGKVDGQSLAEELELDEEVEDNFQTEDINEQASPDELPEERPMSVQSRHSIHKARKVLGLSDDPLQTSSKAVEVMPDFNEEEERNLQPQIDYVDAAVQYSPPPSPGPSPQSEEQPLAPTIQNVRPLSPDTGANQGRKRVSVGPTGQPRTGSPIPEAVSMTSSSCQTTGDLPSPPWTPKAPDGFDLPDTAVLPDKIETSSISTQTDELETTKLFNNDQDTEVHPLDIPIIAIHPPAPGPPSERTSVVLPPRTKNASCQVDLRPQIESRSIAMQTEEIRIDKRPVQLPPHLLPSAVPDLVPQSEDRQTIPPFRVPPPRSTTRRKFRSPPPIGQPVSGPTSKRLEKTEPYSPNNDSGPLNRNVRSELKRPPRSSSLFAGFAPVSDEEGGEPDEERFSDEELFNRPMIKYTLNKGKLVSQAGASLEDGALPNIEEPDSAIEREAQDEFKDDEDAPSLPTMRKRTSIGKLPENRARIGKAPPAARQPDIRRAAMISSGAAAHQSTTTRSRSPSAPSIASNSSSVAQAPFPVPTRSSSRKIPISSSEGATSPTPYSNGQFPDQVRGLSKKPPLRKVRSAAAIPRHVPPTRPRSRSPTLDSQSTVAPDMESPRLPPPPPMPFDDITAHNDRRTDNGLTKPRPPTRNESAEHPRQDSEAAGIVQQTSVVGAIAQTMVGEWMWKYVRRRKSFGVTDSKAAEWETGKNGEELSASITNNGVRHKRWIWLAPYERAVMWSSKQPTSGPALLGKSGRKLTIQSVLDVKDDNPLPKGSSPTLNFNRSILILTPQRALKFTAMSQERHYVWLTALSFLSHSPLGINDLAALPPMPQEEYVPPPSQTSSLRRNRIRDSIQISKGKGIRPGNGIRSFTTGHSVPPSVPQLPTHEVDLYYGANEAISDAADPPNVPRFSAHSRKRSNTAPRPPPSAFRSFSSGAAPPPPSTYSATTHSSDSYAPSSVGGTGMHSTQSSISHHRTSEASGPRPGGVPVNNFFDAVGTVRMEAFVDRQHEPKQRQSYRTRQGRKKDMSYWGVGPPSEGSVRPSVDGSETSGIYRTEDPFRGF